LINGFVPSTAQSWSLSTPTRGTVNSQSMPDSIDSADSESHSPEPEFKIGGFGTRTPESEDSDNGVEDDNKLETQVERYPKYAEVNAPTPTKGKRGTIQVCDFDYFCCSD